jgi:outer membrane protein
MFSKGLKSQSVINILLILGLVVGIAYSNWSKPKTGFILIHEVYNNFGLKKELEKKFLATKNARQKMLDSLELSLKFLANKIQQQKEKNKDDILVFNNKRDEYLQKKQIIEEDNTALTNQYDGEILTQLNQYVKDYGAEKNYTYVYGIDGNGALMYGKEGENITKEMIEYINNKYNGKR